MGSNGPAPPANLESCFEVGLVRVVVEGRSFKHKEFLERRRKQNFLDSVIGSAGRLAGR